MRVGDSFSTVLHEGHVKWKYFLHLEASEKRDSDSNLRATLLERFSRSFSVSCL